jgi:hypothetical protein
MYYRRKVVLSLLEVFDNKLEKIRLQRRLNTTIGFCKAYKHWNVYNLEIYTENVRLNR